MEKSTSVGDTDHELIGVIVGKEEAAFRATVFFDANGMDICTDPDEDDFDADCVLVEWFIQDRIFNQMAGSSQGDISQADRMEYRKEAIAYIDKTVMQHRKRNNVPREGITIIDAEQRSHERINMKIQAQMNANAAKKVKAARVAETMSTDDGDDDSTNSDTLSFPSADTSPVDHDRLNLHNFEFHELTQKWYLLPRWGQPNMTLDGRLLLDEDAFVAQMPYALQRDAFFGIPPTASTDDRGTIATMILYQMMLLEGLLLWVTHPTQLRGQSFFLAGYQLDKCQSTPLSSSAIREDYPVLHLDQKLKHWGRYISSIVNNSVSIGIGWMISFELTRELFSRLDGLKPQPLTDESLVSYLATMSTPLWQQKVTQSKQTITIKDMFEIMPRTICFVCHQLHTVCPRLEAEQQLWVDIYGASWSESTSLKSLFTHTADEILQPCIRRFGKAVQYHGAEQRIYNPSIKPNVIGHGLANFPKASLEAHTLVRNWPGILGSCVAVKRWEKSLSFTGTSRKALQVIRSDVLTMLSTRCIGAIEQPLALMWGVNLDSPCNDQAILNSTTLVASLRLSGLDGNMLIERVAVLQSTHQPVVPFSMFVLRITPQSSVTEIVQSLADCFQMARYRSLKRLLIDASSFAKEDRLACLHEALKVLATKVDSIGYFSEIKMCVSDGRDYMHSRGLANIKL